MKQKKLHNVLLLPVLLFTMLLASCQEELIEVIQDQPEDLIEVNSEIATLLQKTALNDGSKDNIIDNSSCFNVVLPVHVFVNGLEIIIDSEDDFEVIEAIFDEFQDDDDTVDFAFPITIVLADFTEITLENQEELEAYMDECSDGNDDDIECIDFVYPIEFSIFNAKFNLIDTKTVNSDKELYHFVRNISASDVVSINFPIAVELSDGTILNIQNMMDLKLAIKEAINSCDEDDDNDYGDDDFTKERLDALLISCPWEVREFKRNSLSLSDKYFEYVMRFYEDGKVKVKARNGDQLTGTWETRITDAGAKITMEFESLFDLNLEWTVHDLSNGRIKLFAEGGNRIILKKNCDIEIDYTPEEVAEILKECFWRVNRLSIDGTNMEDQYLGTLLNFKDDNVVKLLINGQLISGTWELYEFNHRIILEIHLENRPELALKWVVNVLEEDLVKLSNNNSKFILKRFCLETADADVLYIRNVLYGGTWHVALFNSEDTNKTASFNDFHIKFKQEGELMITLGDTEFKGSWLALRDDGKLMLELNFPEDYDLNEMNHKWKIISINEGRIELHDYSESGNLEQKLVFEKFN